ncbi:NifB/NifX family molybdenum-iron cluster-binding protein [Acetomicrobium sp.]|uniref:NifB/NifX family molybdenum-iron cluster-binding protein n=1 Tax=Acetomicrobium sp. TaxID=1872099 RepID=UPI002B259BF3|nr:NifB/NifX family molybdenum-iron cluster-binding protein [Acetomicrobium sp.]
MSKVKRQKEISNVKAGTAFEKFSNAVPASLILKRTKKGKSSKGDEIKMKLAVTAQGKDLDAALDPRFGRCQYFIIIDLDAGKHEAVVNKYATEAGGAGIQSAQLLADYGVDVLVTGKVGPKAARALKEAGIEVYAMTSGRVREAVEAYKEGKLTRA